MKPYQIKSDADYQLVMEQVELYLKKATENGGFQSLNNDEKTTLQQLSIMAEAWEDGIPIFPIKQPQTIVEMIEFKMYERRLKQKDLAQLLDIPASRLSEVMQEKRKINIQMAKRLYKVLQIDPAFILDKA
jgi:HTH-type transcriptional regulator / antitoxin HigA